MTNSIFILSHQDDEFGVFESIRSAVKNNDNVLILYMTSGKIIKEIPRKKIFYRDKESLKVLSKLGVKDKNIFFFGRLNNIPTCRLHKRMNIAYLKLSQLLKKNFWKNKNIYTRLGRWK